MIDITDTNISGGVAVANKAGSHVFTLESDSTVDGAVKISNGDGDSVTTISGPVITGAVSIKNGLGMDTLTIASVIGNKGAWSVSNGAGGSDTTVDSVHLQKGFSITNGAGANDTVIDGCEIRGAISIKNGDGDSDTDVMFTWAGMDEDHEVFAGGFTLTEGAGNHKIYLEELDVAKAAKITTGGSASITLYNSWFHGATTIKTGGEADSVVVEEHSWMDKSLLIDTGAGNDEISLDDGEFDMNVTIKAGLGDDILAVETKVTGLDMTTYVDGTFSVSMGAGNDQVTCGIDGAGGNAAELYGKVILDGGADYDSVTVSDTTTSEYEPVVKGFEEEDIPMAP